KTVTNFHARYPGPTDTPRASARSGRHRGTTVIIHERRIPGRAAVRRPLTGAGVARRIASALTSQGAFMTSLSALWLPILVSAVLVYIVSTIIHMVLHAWHSTDYPKVPNEDKVMDALRPFG